MRSERRVHTAASTMVTLIDAVAAQIVWTRWRTRRCGGGFRCWEIVALRGHAVVVVVVVFIDFIQHATSSVN